MTYLSNSVNLAVIGFEVAGAGAKDLTSFGFRVFHGSDSEPNANLYQPTGSEIEKMIHKIIFQAGMGIGDVAVIALQPQIADKLSGSLAGSHLKILTSRENDVSHAFELACEQLESGAVHATVLLQEHTSAQCLAAVLMVQKPYALSHEKPVWAVIAGAAHQPESAHGSSDGTLIRSALQTAGLDADAVGLVLTTDLMPGNAEFNSTQDLIAAFPSNNGLTCALAGGEVGLLSIIKALWCLSRRVIPGTQNWRPPADPALWMNSAFYIPTESRTWFTSARQPSRIAIAAFAEEGEPSAVLIFQEGSVKAGGWNTALKLEKTTILPVAGISVQDLLQNLTTLRMELAASPDLAASCSQALKKYQAMEPANSLSACILGQSSEALIREIDFAIKGIPAAIEKKTEWRTPMGSYFSGEPLGKTGKIAFVYPGAFNSYPGLARSIFYLFPDLYSRMGTISSDLGSLVNEQSLYPRSITPLTPAEMDQAEKDLAADPLAMLISGTSLAAVYTFLLEDIFDIHPASAFGYSLGEISMMFASGCWTQADQTSTALRTSPLFHTRLAGPQNAVRENWGITPVDQSEENQTIWENYVLMASPDDVRSTLEKESRVYLTHINTPRQVVIAGDPSGCRRVIEALKCNSLQAPFNYALHCEAMRSEFNALKDLLSWPVTNHPEMKLYFAASNQAVPMEQNAISEKLAAGLCHTLDFPGLVNSAYLGGARIFIELGAGSNCARWVDESLKDRPHAAFSINRKGLDDHAAVLQLLAKLICHQVPVNLSALTA